jgi:dolichyl-phosphate beta-glucosyltransferase
MTEAAAKDAFLSIVIPAYNEEGRIGATLDKVLGYLDGKSFVWEIIVVDDGSNDNTTGVVKAYGDRGVVLLSNNSNRGKGYSVKRGVMSARGDHILFSDADLSTPIEEIEKMFEYIEQGYDAVIGSRGLEQSNIVKHQPWYREGMGKAFNRIVRLATVDGFVDTQCGFKLFKREAAKRVFDQQKLHGFAFDVEIVFLLVKHGYRVKEMPVSWTDSPLSRVRIFRHPLQMFIDVIKIRYIHR